MSGFFDEFADALRSVDGTEHQQLLGYLSRARHIAVSSSLAAAVYDAVNDQPSSIERNMDLIAPLQEEVLWIEVDGYSRRLPADRAGGARADDDDKVGYLVTRHAADPDILVTAIARKTPDHVGGACYLMPGFCAISLPELTEFAFTSRRFFDRDRKKSQRRLMMMVRAYIPPGIESEIRKLGEISKAFDDEANLLAARSAAAPEGAFFVATLLALSALNVGLTGDAETIAEIKATRPPARFRAARALGMRIPEAGFLRSGTNLHLIG